MKKTRDQAAQDNRALQLNPEHPTYHRARGLDPKAAELAVRPAQERRQPRTSPPESPSAPTGTRSPR